MPLHRDREEDIEAMLNKGSLWAVTYGDLMSFLMVFFLILFALTLKNDSAAEERTEMRRQEVSAAESMKERLYARGLQRFATVDVTERRIQVTLREPILFASGGAELKAQALPLLHEFAESVRDLPNAVVVEGYTDNRPTKGGRWRDNWELSMGRAASVIRYMVEVEKLDPGRVSGVGFGEHRPAAENDTPEGRAINRRIEISLLRRE